MLKNVPVVATLPVSDLSRAKTFYQNVLGLKSGPAFPNGIIMQAGKGTGIALFHRPPTKTEHTVAWFTVTDFDQTAEQLRAKGVKFDKYPTGGAKEIGDGIYAFGGFKAAWFKDPDGNILAIGTKI